jgi:hypothetical protein
MTKKPKSFKLLGVNPKILVPSEKKDIKKIDETTAEEFAEANYDFFKEHGDNTPIDEYNREYFQSDWKKLTSGAIFNKVELTDDFVHLRFYGFESDAGLFLDFEKVPKYAILHDTQNNERGIYFSMARDERNPHIQRLERIYLLQPQIR